MSEHPADFSRLDDSTLIRLRARMRAKLAELPPLSDQHAALTIAYDASTAEISDRARRAWPHAE